MYHHEDVPDFCLDDLPQDVLKEISLYLDPLSILRLRHVNKMLHKQYATYAFQPTDRASRRVSFGFLMNRCESIPDEIAALKPSLWLRLCHYLMPPLASRHEENERQARLEASIAGLLLTAAAISVVALCSVAMPILAISGFIVVFGLVVINFFSAIGDLVGGLAGQALLNGAKQHEKQLARMDGLNKEYKHYIKPVKDRQSQLAASIEIGRNTFFERKGEVGGAHCHASSASQVTESVLKKRR